jgi:hypothetical protein
MHERENKYKTKEELEKMGFLNLVKQADERIAAQEAGLDLRPLITKVCIYIYTHTHTHTQREALHSDSVVFFPLLGPVHSHTHTHTHTHTHR